MLGGHLVLLRFHTPHLAGGLSVPLGQSDRRQTDRVVADQMVVKPQVIDPGPFGETGGSWRAPRPDNPIPSDPHLRTILADRYLTFVTMTTAQAPPSDPSA